MEIKIGCIGIGACGNNIASELGGIDVPFILINSTEDDMDKLDTELCRGKIIFDELNGTGKDRSKTKSEVIAGFEPLMEQLQELGSEILDSDIVLLPTSTNGGTGSGSTPILTEVLNAEFDTVFIPIGVTPRHDDDVQSFENSVNFGAELDEIGVPYMLFDNNKVKGPVFKTHKEINAAIVDKVQKLRGDMIERTNIQGTDKTEWMETVSRPGLLTIYSVEDFSRNELENEGVESLFSKSFLRDFQVDRQRNNDISRIMIIKSLERATMENTGINNSEIKKEVGEGRKTFQHIQFDDKNYLDVILSGQSFPDDVFEKLMALKKEHDRLIAKHNESKIGDIAKSMEHDTGERNIKKGKSAASVIDKWKNK